MSLERRMQRNRARQERRLVREAPPGTVPPTMLADFFKGIALQVGNLEFKLSEIGGYCVFRTLAAYQAIHACGVDVFFGFGSLVARIGPDEERDVVAFCGPHNAGCVLPNGYAAFHCWIKYQDWIFDPSLSEWKNLNTPATELAAFGYMLPPPQWTIDLPRYWLKPAAELELPWQSTGTPALGQAWYGPFCGDPEIITQRIRRAHSEFGPHIVSALATACDQQGAPRFDGDPLYPLKFQARVAKKRG
jgi:hypothetical protein